jgi:hypothetical protein
LKEANAVDYRIPRIILVPLLFAALVALSAPAFGAENATITGDGVRVREAPSTLAEIVETVNKGMRMEVVAKTDFSDTIEGRTSPWYKFRGWNEHLPRYVFGAFVKLDAGVEVPTVSLKSGDKDLMTAFIVEGLFAFGKHKSEVEKKLGPPLSETKERGQPMPGNEGFEFYLYTLLYDGVVIRGTESDEAEWIYEVSYTSDAYDLGGVRVGCSVEDVERVLGPAFKDPENPSHMYYGGQMYYYLQLVTDEGRVAEITFTFSAGD